MRRNSSATQNSKPATRCLFPNGRSRPRTREFVASPRNPGRAKSCRSAASAIAIASLRTPSTPGFLCWWKLFLHPGAAGKQEQEHHNRGGDRVIDDHGAQVLPLSGNERSPQTAQRLNIRKTPRKSRPSPQFGHRPCAARRTICIRGGRHMSFSTGGVYSRAGECRN